jgi:hypothetical protein
MIEAAVAVAVLAAGAFAAIHYNKQGAGPDAAMPDPNVVAPAGIVTAVSADSISIRRQENGAERTFAITPATLVISQVSSGETGKGLSDITAGTLVVLRPSPSNPSTIDSIQISAAGSAAPSAPADAPSGPPVSFMGTVVTASPSLLVIKPEGAGAGAGNIEVTITGDTAVRSNVLAGQKGKTFDDIRAGTPVFVAGSAGSGSGVVAGTVQVLVPISELAR